MKKILSVLLALLTVAGTLALPVSAVENSAEESEPTVEVVESEDVEVPDAVESEEDDTNTQESVDAPVTSPGEESDDAPAGDVSEEDDSSIGAEQEVREVTFSVAGEGRVSVKYGGKTFSKIGDGSERSIEAVVGEDAVFTVLPADGYAIALITVGTIDEYVIDEEANTVTIKGLSRNADVRIRLTDAETAEVAVEVWAGSDGEPHGTFDYPDISYVVGGTLNLSLLPDNNYGVKSVTVNGEELTELPLISGTVSIPVEEKIQVYVEYALLYDVYINCGEGGSFTVNGAEVPNGMVRVPEGRKITLNIVPDEGRTVESISLSNGDSVSGRTEYTFSVEQNERVTVSFEEEEAVYYVTTQVVEGVGGAIFSNAEQVHEGDSVAIGFVPEDGYEIEYVMVNGVKWEITGEEVSITNITENKHVKVKYKLIEEENSDDIVEEPEESVEEPEPVIPDESSTPVYGEDELMSVKKEDANGDVIISLANTTVINSSGLAYINELLATKNVRLGVEGRYWWTIPQGAAFTVGKTVDFGVEFNGDNTDMVVEFFQEKADLRGYDKLPPLIYVKRNSDYEMPDGALLKINAVDISAEKDRENAFNVGSKVEWIKHKPGSKEEQSFIYDRLLKVDNDGWLTAAMDYQYGVFLGYIDPYSSIVTVMFDSELCQISAREAVPVEGEDYDWVELSQKNDKPFNIYVSSKGGYAIKKINSDYENMVLLDEKGNDITNSDYAGKYTGITIRISDMKKDGKITVDVEEVKTETKAKADNGVKLEIIILIVVVAIVVVGGGAIFVIKWRQSDEDDDEEDYEDYEDEQ